MPGNYTGMESNLWSFGILKKILFSFEWLEEKAFDLKLLYSKGTDLWQSMAGVCDEENAK